MGYHIICKVNTWLWYWKANLNEMGNKRIESLSIFLNSFQFIEQFLKKRFIVQKFLIMDISGPT